MAVKIRLTRRGRKKKAIYDVIVADARSPRDGKLIEKLGTYNPLTNPATIVLDDDKTLDWLLKGAQPTDTARRILSHKGILLKKHLQVGVLKGAITQEQADKKFEDWLKDKEAEVAGLTDSLAKKKADEAKAKLDAEKKINEAKAEKLKEKLAALVPVEEVEEPAAESKEEAPIADAAPVEEVKAPAETPKAEEKVEEVKAESTETPEAKEEAPVEEPKTEAKEEAKTPEEAPKTEEKAEATEAKEEAPAEEKKEEEKK